jgi:hypothetical protein
MSLKILLTEENVTHFQGKIQIFQVQTCKCPLTLVSDCDLYLQMLFHLPWSQSKSQKHGKLKLGAAVCA